MSSKKLAVVCNYVLRPDRVGGMDRFFVAYDAAAKRKGYTLDWYFPEGQKFEFYKGLEVYSARGNYGVEAFFLKHIAETGATYDTLVTHFTELCTSFYPKARTAASISNIIAVDHNPRPLNGFPIKKQLKLRLKAYMYHKAIDRFIGVSSYTARHIVQDLGKVVARKTGVIYNGIDTSVFIKREAPSQIKTLFKCVVVSHLRASKGIQDLLAALALLNPDLQKKFQVDIYGEGPLEEALKQQVEDLKLSHSIHFKGSSSQIPQLLAGYDYLIQPTYMECFSLSILEGLSANVPVITTTVGGNPEIITDGENGFLFKPKDQKTLAKILKEILSGKRGITTDTSTLIRQEFSLDRMVAEHINLLD